MTKTRVTIGGGGVLAVLILFGSMALGLVLFFALGATWPIYLQIPLAVALLYCWARVASWGIGYDEKRIAKREDGIALELLQKARHSNSLIYYTLFLRPFEFDSGLVALPSLIAPASPIENYITIAKSEWGAVNSSIGPYDLQDQLQKICDSTCVCVGERTRQAMHVGTVITSDQDWQDTVETLMKRAELVVLFPWITGSSGILWELDRALSAYVGKCIFVMPPSYAVRSEVERTGSKAYHKRRVYLREPDLELFEQRKATWDQISKIFETAGAQCPTYSTEGCLFAYSGDLTLWHTRFPHTQPQWRMVVRHFQRKGALHTAPSVIS